ncbi:MAG: hypothetical protein NTV34_07530, partial [Proteobacteria bacterium]|nr:hypothetical protein [Pseudomonadota bacterium]
LDHFKFPFLSPLPGFQEAGSVFYTLAEFGTYSKPPHPSKPFNDAPRLKGSHSSLTSDKNGNLNAGANSCYDVNPNTVYKFLLTSLWRETRFAARDVFRAK